MFIFIFRKSYFYDPLPINDIINQTKIMFQIIKFTLSDWIYPIECTYIRIEDLLWPRQILRAVKVRAIWWGKEPCSFWYQQKGLATFSKIVMGKFSKFQIKTHATSSLGSFMCKAYPYTALGRPKTSFNSLLSKGSHIVRVCQESNPDLRIENPAHYLFTTAVGILQQGIHISNKNFK